MHRWTKTQRIARLIFAGFMCAGLLTTPQAHAEPDKQQGKSEAEKAGWTLAFEDDFERDELGDTWQPIKGKWEIEDGTMRGSGTIITAQGFPPSDEPPGYQRVEFEAVTDVQALSFLQVGDQKADVRISDISTILHAKAPGDDEESNPLTTGYFVQFGGYWNSENQIRKQGDRLIVDDEPEVTIEADKTHHIVAENDEGHLRLIVDGEPVLDYEQRMSLMGSSQNRIGFYFHTAVKVDNVKVYVKQLPGGYDRD